MSLAMAKKEAAALTTLATEIEVEHDAAERDARSCVEHAIRCGELLVKAKGQIRHGEWMPWLEKNFPGTVQTASGYMRLAANRDQIESASSIRSALSELAEPRAAAVAAESPLPEFEEDKDSPPPEEVVTGEVVPDDDPTPELEKQCCPTCGRTLPAHLQLPPRRNRK